MGRREERRKGGKGGWRGGGKKRTEGDGEEGGKEGREGGENSQILAKTSMMCGHSPCGSEDGEDKLVFVEGVKVLSPKNSRAGRGANTNQQVWGRVRGT